MATFLQLASQFAGKTTREKTAIKTAVLAELSIPRTARQKVDIEVVSFQQFEGGISVFVRAWRKDGEQIGFGDGTVDIERIRIFLDDGGVAANASWLVVPDVNGLIKRDETFTNLDGSTYTERVSYRFDPKEHLLMFLERVIAGLQTHDSKNIISGKTGNTVSTFNPHSADGVVNHSGTTWSTVRSASTGTTVVNNVQDEWLISGDKDGTTFGCSALFLAFDTSAIPDTDTISSATLFVRQTNNAGEGLRSFSVLQTSQASATALATSDYDNRGLGGSEGIDSRETMNTANSDHTMTLNATGIGWISKTGYSLFGITSSYEIDNTTPTVRNYTRLAHSENTTAAYRPLLSVTHSAGASSAIKTINGLSLASVKTVNGLAIASVKTVNGLA